MKVTVKDLTRSLQEKLANHCAYLWGASGQIVGKTTPDEILAHEKTSNAPKTNAKRVLARVGTMVDAGYDLDKAQFFDCSGLVLDSLNKLGLYIGDTTADGLFLNGTAITVKNAKEGDLVFLGSDKKKNHVGYVVGGGSVIECKGRDFGVVESSLSEWKYAAHYTWFDDLKISRKLKIQADPLTGADVVSLQKALCSHGFPCAVSGSYTTNTAQAVERFQKAAKLTVLSYGVVAKKTAEALGITWVKK